MERGNARTCVPGFRSC
ncbi:hypothetical protein [Mycobacterium sp.]